MGCSLSGRNLTSVEWKSYIGELFPYEKTCTNSLNLRQEYLNHLPPIMRNGSNNQRSIIHVETNMTDAGKAGKWKTISILPNSIKEDFSAFIQCRANEDTDILTNDFLGIWAVSIKDTDMWIPSGKGVVYVRDIEDKIVNQYDVPFMIGGPTDWIISTYNKSGYVMFNPNNGDSVLELNIQNAIEERKSNSEEKYDYTHEIVSFSSFGNPEYPRHLIGFLVHNVGEGTLKSLNILGVLYNQRGQVVDLLHQNNTVDISGKGERYIVINSLSSSGRCVGSASNEYNLQYWINFYTSDGQGVTRYYSQSVK